MYLFFIFSFGSAQAVDVESLEFYVKTADIKYAGTDDHIYVKLNNNHKSFIDTPKYNDFERGDGKKYQLSTNYVDTHEDVIKIEIGKDGTNGWCIEKFILYGNGYKVFEKTFSPCHWLDNEPTKNRQRVWSISGPEFLDNWERYAFVGVPERHFHPCDPNPPEKDSDKDCVDDKVDQCPGQDDRIDVDADGIPDCNDPLIDSDKDGVADKVDQCPGQNDTIDVDRDGIPDCIDSQIDSDNDGVADGADQCPGQDDRIDVDADGIPDCIDSQIDSDKDGIADNVDQCPSQPEFYNSYQDADGCPDKVSDDSTHFQSAKEKVTPPVLEDFSQFPKPKKVPTPVLDTRIYELQRSPNPQKTAKQFGIEIIDGNVELQLTLSNFNSNVISKIRSVSTIENIQENLVRIYMDYNKINQLLEISEIKNIRPPPELFLQSHIVTEGLEFIKANYAHDSDLTGKGIKIAILDMGFDIKNTEFSNNIKETKQFRTFFGKRLAIDDGGRIIVHGTGVAEIIVDIAPRAELYLYGMDKPDQVIEAIQHAIDQKVDLITMSATFMLPTDGSSSVTKKFEEAANRGIPGIVSVGNYAQEHWEGQPVDNDNDGWLDYKLNDEGLTFDLRKGDNLKFYLLWYDEDLNEATDYDIALFDPNGKSVAYSANNQRAGENLYEIIKYEDVEIDGLYKVGITYPRGAPPRGTLEVFAPYMQVEYPIESGSAVIPSDAVGVISVGALDHFSGKLREYSSQGKTNNGLQAPNVMGPDGVSTVAHGELGFFGTSAAAPHVAGLVALMLEKDTSWSPEQVTYGLQEYAGNEIIDLEYNVDSIYGYGTADASFLTQQENIEDISNSDYQFEEGTIISILDDDEADDPLVPQGIDPPEKNGCLIATATFGSELAPQVQQLRELRDNTLLQTNSGTLFMSGFNTFYYTFSPGIADWERQSPVFKEAVKLAISPLITSLSLLNYVDIDSEAEVLGYGIALILLNIGMYFVAPVAVILKIKKRFE